MHDERAYMPARFLPAFLPIFVTTSTSVFWVASVSLTQVWTCQATEVAADAY